MAWERGGVRVVIAVAAVRGRCRGAEADHVTGKPRGVAMSGKHLKECMRQLVTDLTGEGRPALHGKAAGSHLTKAREKYLRLYVWGLCTPVVAEGGNAEITENIEWEMMKMKTGNKMWRTKKGQKSRKKTKKQVKS